MTFKLYLHCVSFRIDRTSWQSEDNHVGWWWYVASFAYGQHRSKSGHWIMNLVQIVELLKAIWKTVRNHEIVGAWIPDMETSYVGVVMISHGYHYIHMIYRYLHKNLLNLIFENRRKSGPKQYYSESIVFLTLCRICLVISITRWYQKVDCVTCANFEIIQPRKNPTILIFRDNQIIEY